MPSWKSKSWVVVALVGAIACGGSGKKAGGPELELGAPGVAWKVKSTEQRMGYMAAVVHPEMERVFKEYDADYYSDFSCKTCHGPDMDIADFKMPTDYIYSLPEDGPIKEAMDYDEEVAEFMMSKVVPGLKKLLNAGKGGTTKVDCFSCHPKE